MQEIAIESGFQQRKSNKITPRIFLNLVTLLYKDHHEDSLEYLSYLLNSRYQINISKQGLDQRFSPEAEQFLLILIRKLLSCQLNVALPIHSCLQGFSKVRIKDSTEFKGYRQNADRYKGFNSAGTESCFQIQYEYDVKSGRIEELSLHAGNHSDQTDAKQTLESIQAGDLLIRDLGYISQQVLDQTHQRGAFYLNKIKRNVLIYKPNGLHVSYRSILNRMHQYGLCQYEDRLYAGQKIHHISRVLFSLVPDEVYKQRLCKLKSAGKPISKEDRARARLNVYITNADQEKLPMCIAIDLYRIRWQIEIEFKVWKSTARIASVKNTKTSRIVCYLPGKLIWQLISNQARVIIGHLKPQRTGISSLKFGKIMSQKQSEIHELSTQEIVNYIAKTLSIPEKFYRRESKKNNIISEIFLGFNHF